MNRRAVLRGAVSSALAFTSARTLASGARFDATLSRDASPWRGAPGFRTLTEALAAAPPGDAPYRVFIPAGDWREHNRVTRANVALVGESRAASRLVFDDRANAPRDPDVPGSTLEVRAPGFSAEHLTIYNDFDYPHNMPADVPHDRTGASGAQARALHLDTGADRSVFVDVALNGWQDTLFVDVGRALFKGCYVSGAVDFIYGAGIVLFDHCEIRSRTRPGKDFHGFIVAPDTDVHQKYGIVFDRCRLTKDADMPAHTVALGRPWRRTITFPDGRYGNPDAVPFAVYLQCWMDDHIVPEGWYEMHYNNKAGERVMLQPEEARLFEFRSVGPGASRATTRRRHLAPAMVKALFGRQPALAMFGDWKPRA